MDSQWEFALRAKELWDNLKGWDVWEVVGDSRGRGYMYIQGWFLLMYDRNQHNVVKQLSSN